METQPPNPTPPRQPASVKHTIRNRVLVVWPLVFMLVSITLGAVITTSSTTTNDANGYLLIFIAMIGAIVWPFGIFSLIWGTTRLAAQLDRATKTMLGHILIWSPGALLIVGAIIHDIFFKNNDAGQVVTFLFAAILTLLALPSVISGIIILVSRNKQHI